MIEILCDDSTSCKEAGDNNYYHRPHAREPLYSKSAVIACWSQSTSGENGVVMYTLLLKMVIVSLIFYF